MDLQTAIEKANEILDEERTHPTVRYRVNPTLYDERLVAAAVGDAEADALGSPRKRPREITEDPTFWVFESVNYTLLCALRSQVPPGSGEQFTTTLLSRIASQDAKPESELPLIIEFCVRKGATSTFLQHLCHLPLTDRLVPLLHHMEALIALNWTAVTDAEYRQLENCASAISSAVMRLREQDARSTGVFGPFKRGGGELIDRLAAYDKIEASANGILEQCRKARYLHLKGSLLRGLNLEINQDKEAVTGYVSSLQLNPALSESLGEAERLYQSGGDGFAMKSCMGHLRSFMENLLKETMPRLHAKIGGKAPVATWGAGLIYLRTNGFMTLSEEQYAVALFRIISDEGVHPLIAEREYARLTRNVVIEFALWFLSTAERKLQ